jgi:hypothetical protein
MDYSDPFGSTFGSSKITVNTISNHSLELLKDQLSQLGLDLERLKWHEACVTEALSTDHRPSFQILDTCRRDNGGVILTRELSEAADDPSSAASGFVAFVPAAGAASRYAQPFLPLIQALEKGDSQDIEECLDQLLKLGADKWPLPGPLASLLRQRSGSATLSQEDIRTLHNVLHLPKALMPCVMEGDSFLALKVAEHKALNGLSGQVFIAPPDMKELFQQVIEGFQKDHANELEISRQSLGAHIILQGPSLSTIRFNRDGTPFIGTDGRCSLVPAGHGALIEILPEVAQIYPDAHSVFIRNIDNVIGTKKQATDATYSFLGLHKKILQTVKQVREALRVSDLCQAASAVDPLLNIMRQQDPERLFTSKTSILDSIRDPYERILWEAQSEFFHTPLPADLNLKELKKVYGRPVNTLGQVPNTGKDVGGTPCFVRFGEKAVKICIELPHVSEQDKSSYLFNAAKATHFNPVFAAAELIDEDRLPELRSHGFWILSEKTHKGHPVVYFETILYELLGNSYLANCTFVEVPRIVFNPHKSINDAAGRCLGDWLASE